MYLLLAECEVRTASYGPSFFLPFMAQAQSARALKERKEKNEYGQITCVRTEQTGLKRCLLCGFVDYFGKGTRLFYVLVGNRDQEIRMATYGPGINQSQHARSVDHIIIITAIAIVLSDTVVIVVSVSVNVIVTVIVSFTVGVSVSVFVIGC